MPTITLLTDFGTAGIYVGAMKGVIAALCPEARVIDLTHEVTPQAIREGAFLLENAHRYFTADTIHLAVIDPGVGTARRAIALEIPGVGRFVGPDNGLFTPLLLAYPGSEARQITNPDFSIARLGHPISATFHGRDIFAPTAALLAGGAPFASLGPRLANDELVCLPNFWATAESTETLRGEIVHIDRFGNLITNIRRETLEDRSATGESLRIEVGPHECHGLVGTYGAREAGEIIALYGSGGTLEIARVDGRADREASGATVALGARVAVTQQPAQTSASPPLAR